MTPVSPTRPVSVPSDVLAFAAEQGVDTYLADVLAMTQRQFPDARRVLVGVEDDPEVPCDRHVLIWVDAPGLDAEAYANAKFRWGGELFRLCPAPLVCVFRCALGVEGP
jgi:hypothetical protein